MKSNNVLLSPRKYIMQRAKNLPIKECLIETNYKELGMTNVAIVRQESGNKYTIGVFCVDLFCLGVKDAFCNCHMDEDAYNRICNMFTSGAMEVSPTFAHNLIYGAIDFAEEIGFFPHKDFKFAENILDDSLVDEGINEIEFGLKGRPAYVSGPNDNQNQILKHLEKFVGQGNYEFIATADNF